MLWTSVHAVDSNGQCFSVQGSNALCVPNDSLRNTKPEHREVTKVSYLYILKFFWFGHLNYCFLVVYVWLGQC